MDKYQHNYFHSQKVTNHQTNHYDDQSSLQAMENKVTVAVPSHLSGSASKPKLCIKIKNPSTKEGSRSEVHGLGYRVCDICGKTFSSGKAWGGHKRHHVKAIKDIKPKSRHGKTMKKHGSKLVKSCNTIKAGDVSTNHGIPRCCLCGKTFPSMNSLFGHMRFHPDRGWKGTQPPSSRFSSIASDSTLEVETDKMEEGLGIGVDLLRSLSGWSKTDRRGRVSISDPIPQAALSLMTLSRDTGRSNKQKMEASTAELQSKCASKKRKINETETRGSASEAFGANESGNKMVESEGKAVLETGSNHKGVSMVFECGDSNLPGEDMDNVRRESAGFLTKKKKKKKKKMMMIMNMNLTRGDLQAAEGNGLCHHIQAMGIGGFGCSTCRKSIPTFRSLGHHRSSYICKDENTEHVNKPALMDDAFAADEKSHTIPASADDETEECKEDGTTPMGTSFQSDLHNKTFLTHQALGGHKRCHWRSPDKAPSDEIASPGEASYVASNTASSEEASQAGEAIQPGRRILGIDLNKPYIIQDGE